MLGYSGAAGLCHTTLTSLLGLSLWCWLAALHSSTTVAVWAAALVAAPFSWQWLRLEVGCMAGGLAGLAAGGVGLPGWLACCAVGWLLGWLLPGLVPSSAWASTRLTGRRWPALVCLGDFGTPALHHPTRPFGLGVWGRAGSLVFVFARHLTRGRVGALSRAGLLRNSLGASALPPAGLADMPSLVGMPESCRGKPS